MCMLVVLLWSSVGHDPVLQIQGTARMEATCGHLSLANHEVFDAEATAALAGLKAAFSCPPNTPEFQLIYITGQPEGCPPAPGHPSLL